MKIQLCSDAWGNTIVTPYGEVDFSNSEELKLPLLCVLHNLGSAVLIILLDEVPFLDSTGLGVLVAVHHRAELLGVDLRLVAPTPEPEKVLRITRLDQHVAIYPSLADAQKTAPRGAGQANQATGSDPSDERPDQPTDQLFHPLNIVGHGARRYLGGRLNRRAEAGHCHCHYGQPTEGR